MKTVDFQHLLLQAAVVAMAADGEVAEEEKQELARIVNSTAYFLGSDHTTTLPVLLADSSNFGNEAIRKLTRLIQEGDLKPRQEEVLLEVLLRIVEADSIVNSAEREMLRVLRPCFQQTDTALLTRFPRLLNYMLPSSDDSLHS